MWLISSPELDQDNLNIYIRILCNIYSVGGRGIYSTSFNKPEPLSNRKYFFSNFIFIFMLFCPRNNIMELNFFLYFLLSYTRVLNYVGLYIHIYICIFTRLYTMHDCIMNNILV